MRLCIAEEALVPGLFSFLGGSGLFVNAKASKEQQDLGWELLKRMILDVSNYALVQRSPPPLEVRAPSIAVT